MVDTIDKTTLGVFDITVQDHVNVCQKHPINHPRSEKNTHCRAAITICLYGHTVDWACSIISAMVSIKSAISLSNCWYNQMAKVK